MSQRYHRPHVAVRTWLVLVSSLSMLMAGQCPSDGDGNSNDNTNGNQNTNDNTNQNTNVNGNTNDNSSGNVPGPNEIYIQFNFSLDDSQVASALSGNTTEYALFGEKDQNGQATAVDEIDLQLSGNIAARATLDVDNGGRPTSILANDESAVSFNYDSNGLEVEVIYVDTSGLTTRDEFTLDLLASGAQSGGICNLLANMEAVLEQTFGDCAGDESVRCTGAIEQVVEELLNFCSFSQTEVEGLLPAGIGIAPSLSLPLGVVVTSEVSTVAPDEGVTMRGTVFGGSAPYQSTWAVVEGPVLGVPVLSNSTGSLSTASVVFPIEGLYTVRLTVIDNAANIAYFNLPFSVAGEPGELNLVITSEISDEDPFQATLTATASGGAPPYEYEWSLVDGPGSVEFSAITLPTTTATFGAAGTYILEADVVDAVDATDTASHAVTIIDPATSLTASIDIPSGNTCASEAIGDACIAFGDAITFDVTLSNQEADDDDLEYTWTITPPSGQSPSFSNDPSIDVDTSQPGTDIPGTWIITVSVTDPVKEETASDQIVLQVQEVGDLAVVILGETSGKIDEPQILIAQVSGFIGSLTYAWSLSSDSPAFGTFDHTDTQSVELTPSTIGTLSVEVTVTDSELPGSPVTAEFDVEVEPFGITGVSGPCTYNASSGTGSCTVMSLSLEDFGVVLSGDAPSDAEFEWVLELADEDDTLSVVILPEEADTQDIQVLTTGDGSFTLSVTVTDPSDENNLDTAVLLVTSTCLAADEPTATALIDDGTMEGTTAVLASMDDVVELDCLSDEEDDANRSFRWRRLDSLGVDFDFDSDFMHDDTSMGAASFVMPPADEVLSGGLTFDCVVSNDLSSCDADSEPVAVYFDPLLADIQDPSVDEGDLVIAQCVQESGSAAVLTWSQESGTMVEFSDDGSGGLSFTAPAGPATLVFHCNPSISSQEGPVLEGAPLEFTVTVNP